VDIRRGSAHPGRLAASFVFLLQSVGIVQQDAPRRFIARSSSPSRCAKVRGDNLKWVRLEPYHGYKLSFEIDFDHRASVPRASASSST